MSEYICEDCGKSYKSRSGLWKHQKKLGHGKFATSHSDRIIEEDADFNTSDDTSILSIESENTQSVGVQSSPDLESSFDTPTDTQYEWMDFDFGSTEDVTDTIPTTFKAVMSPVPNPSGKMSKAQAKALEQQNKGILKMGLSTVDVLLTQYGKAVTLNPDFEVKHSDSDKELVANAQYRWMEEKGFFLTNYLSTGMIASGLTVWYVGSPLMRIRKKRKKASLVGGLLSRLPLIGRLFKRKKDQELPDIGQNVEVGLNES